ncbi:hypothetical protein UP10_18735 [Bradyrhizobium sp. LTSPM299]|jgi:hypothetical protein|uniref:hypothetical protein n=1 Tax=Bradyrhizobium sp. LTSPM299 TaxID=1619233 RepID=UPI0005C84993|nr:hypothetical protein [Bradyrhizobium sp. LTSPM299]KJC59522.1 hypothetical protein UP10_18735 [Bradyrhizobium sp. LTSPM299]
MILRCGDKPGGVMKVSRIDVHDKAQAIVDYGLMLVSLLASSDLREVPDGVRLTVWHMIDHAKAIRAACDLGPKTAA